jgi:hypothetical protein
MLANTNFTLVIFNVHNSLPISKFNCDNYHVGLPWHVHFVNFQIFTKTVEARAFFDGIDRYVFSKRKTICVISLKTIFTVLKISDAIKNSD